MKDLPKLTATEAKAYEAVTGVEGFPIFYGTVDRQPVTSFVLEFLGKPDATKTWTLYDIRCDRGPVISNDDLLKVQD